MDDDRSEGVATRVTSQCVQPRLHAEFNEVGV